VSLINLLSRAYLCLSGVKIIKKGELLQLRVMRI
jgi:hypothetical protein